MQTETHGVCTLSVRRSGNYTVYLFLIIINELGIASRLISSRAALPDGGYLAHPYSRRSYYCRASTPRIAQSNGTRNFGAILPVVY